MQAVVMQGQGNPSACVERPAWTSRDWQDAALFAGQSLAIICAGAVVFALGPGLGIGLVVASLLVLSAARRDSRADAH